jgi:hypothetical protein
MAYSTTTLKANAEAIISGLGGSPSVKELTIASKAAQGLDCSNYSTLEAAIQTKIDSQTTSTPDAEIMLASLLVGATQAKTHTYFETVTLTRSDTVDVPANATRCFVSCSAGTYTYSGNTFGGAYVVEFEIGVQAGGTLSVTKGSGNSGTHIIGGLEIRAGSASSAAAGGKVFLAGALQPVDNITVFAIPDSSGSSGMAASNVDLKFEITEVVT